MYSKATLHSTLEKDGLGQLLGLPYSRKRFPECKHFSKEEEGRLVAAPEGWLLETSTLMSPML